jgi:hypothetical protein
MFYEAHKFYAFSKNQHDPVLLLFIEYLFLRMHVIQTCDLFMFISLLLKCYVDDNYVCKA